MEKALNLVTVVAIVALVLTAIGLGVSAYNLGKPEPVIEVAAAPKRLVEEGVVDGLLLALKCVISVILFTAYVAFLSYISAPDKFLQAVPVKWRPVLARLAPSVVITGEPTGNEPVESEEPVGRLRKQRWKQQISGLPLGSHFSESPEELAARDEALRDALRRQIEAELQEQEAARKKRSRYIPSHVKQAVWERDNGQCVFCGSDEDLHFDHDLPHSKGGSNTVENIQILCASCNLSKSSKIM